jgi:hypothetical protein
MRKFALIGATVMGTVVLSTAPISIKWSGETGLSISVPKAHAVVGRPLTPASAAGVHRKVERRAVRRCAAGATCPHY